MVVQRTIKPIETVYDGHLFRSRLEARWAVFLNSLKVKYEYEPVCERVEFGGFLMSYKPDFYLPDLSLWIEIKPSYPDDTALRKAAGWAENEDIVILWGNIKPLHHSKPPEDSGWHFYWHNRKNKVVCSHNTWWGKCRRCGEVNLTPYGSVGCEDKCFTEEEQEDDSNQFDPTEHPDIAKAYIEAQQAIFGSNDRTELQRLKLARREEDYKARLGGWARKVYGENWQENYDYDEVEEAFSSWLENKGYSR